MKKNKFGVLSIIFILMMGMCACGGTKYTYEETQISDDYNAISMKYCEVSEDFMELSINSRCGLEDCNVYFYDADLEKIDSALEYEWGNNSLGTNGQILKVEGERADEIDGVKIMDNDVELYVRYLQSEQFVHLYYTWADDYGFMLSSGDRDAYYTQEEKDAQAQREAEYQQEQEEIFAQISGKWVMEDGSETYIFTKEEDAFYIEHSYINEEGTTITEKEQLSYFNRVENEVSPTYQDGEVQVCYQFEIISETEMIEMYTSPEKVFYKVEE